jgi:hypothetical protein
MPAFAASALTRTGQIAFANKPCGPALDDAAISAHDKPLLCCGQNCQKPCLRRWTIHDADDPLHEGNEQSIGAANHVNKIHKSYVQMRQINYDSRCHLNQFDGWIAMRAVGLRWTSRIKRTIGGKRRLDLCTASA